MKKAVILEILLLLAIGILIYFSCWCLSVCYTNFQSVNAVPIEIAPDLLAGAYHYLIRGILALVAAVVVIAVMIIIAIKDFPCFQPLVDKYKERKEKRAAEKAERTEAAKQERIEQLQAELDELKKDE